MSVHLQPCLLSQSTGKNSSLVSAAPTDLITYSLNEYHAILHRNKYAILYFCDSHEQCASLDPTYNDMASTVADADDMIDFYKINISQHHDISDAAMVEKPTLLLVKDGRELERFCKPVPQQLEYMVSQALCGMTKISMIPYTEREGHGNLMYCIPAQK